MSEPMLEILPLGPFPPRGPARLGAQLDLGARLRDQLLCRDMVAGPLRKGLQARLARALEAGAGPEASRLLRAWLDSWPVAAAVDPARAEWSAAPSVASLAILGRAGELASLALGWPTVHGTPWPLPPAEWMLAQLDGRAGRLWSRGLDDQHGLVAEALGLSVCGERPSELPPLLRVRGEELAARRAELAGALVRGEAAAVLIEGLVPADPRSQLALGELRLEGPSQRMVERFGPMAAWAQGELRFEDLLGAAPPGEEGPVLRATAVGLLAPGTPERVARGDLETSGYLLWSAAYRPLAVRPVAVEILRALDGERDAAAIARAVQGPLEGVQEVLAALVELGAATAA